MHIDTVYLNSGKAVGADGVATVTVASSGPVAGKLLGAYVKYNGDKPATTDVTVRTQGSGGHAPSRDLLKLTDAVTDGYFPPVVQSVDTAGAPVAGFYVPQPVNDVLEIVLAQANTDDVIEVWLDLER